MVTLTPGTTAPEVSVTVPTMEALSCEYRIAANSSEAAKEPE